MGSSGWESSIWRCLWTPRWWQHIAVGGVSQEFQRQDQQLELWVLQLVASGQERTEDRGAGSGEAAPQKLRTHSSVSRCENYRFAKHVNELFYKAPGV